MRSTSTRRLAVALPAICAIARLSAGDLPHAIPCRRLTGLVEFDGRLSEAAWAEAARLSVELDADAAPGAVFRFLADDRSLYVGWTAEVPPGQEVITRGLVPAPPGAETFERVAVILRPGGPRTAGGHADAAEAGPGSDRTPTRDEIRWQVGAGGQVRVTRGTTLLGDAPQGRVEIAVSPGQWSGELILPRALLDAAPDIDFVRVEHVVRRTPSSKAEGRSDFHPIVFPVALPTTPAPPTDLVEAAWIPGLDRIELPRTVGAEKWAGGALRVLCVGPPQGIAEVVDLARRYEIEAAYLGWDVAAEEVLRAENAARFERFLGHRWDVALVGNVPWWDLPHAARTRLLGHVVDGMGLVMSRTGHDGRVGPWDAAAPSPEDGADAGIVARLVADLPPSVRTPPGGITVHRLGRGRVVHLDRADPAGGFSVAAPGVAWHRQTAPLLREDWMSVAARSLRWAAGRDLLDVAVTPASLRWKAGAGPDARRWALRPGPRAEAVKLETVIYDSDLGIVDVREIEIEAPRFDRLDKTLFLPALPPGQYRLVSRLRDAEVVAAWARTAVTVENAVEGLRVSARWRIRTPLMGEPPEDIELVLSGLPSEPGPDDTAVVRIRDGTGRLLADREMTLSEAEGASLRARFPVVPPATDACTVVVDYIRGGRSVARTRGTLQGASPVLPRPALWIAAPTSDDWWLRSLLSTLWPLDRRQISWIEAGHSPDARLRTERDRRLGFRPILRFDDAEWQRETASSAFSSDPTLRRLVGPGRATEHPEWPFAGQGFPVTRIADDLGTWRRTHGAGVLFPGVVSRDHPRVHLDLRTAGPGSGLDIDDRTLPIASAARWAPWEAVLRGGDVVAVGVRGPARLITADLRPTPTAAVLGEELRILQRGLGDLLARAGSPRHDGMAILWSEQSVSRGAAGLVARDPAEPAHLVAAAGVAACLGGLGYAPVLLEEERLRSDPALLEGVRILWLPWATALHETTVGILRVFVGAGGIVVADGQPAVARHGELGAGRRADLADDFGVEYAAESMRPMRVRVRAVPADPATEFGALCDASVRPRIAEPQQTVAGAPIVAVRSDRRGRWVYLNLWMEDAWHVAGPEAAGLRRLVGELLRRWDLEPPRALVAAVDGAAHSPDCRVARYPWGRRCEIIVASRIPHLRQPPSRDLVLRLDGIRSLYDLRTGSRLTSTDRLNLGPTAPGGTRIFAAWNGQPPLLAATLLTGQATAHRPARIRVRSEEPPLACHVEVVDADGQVRPEYSGVLLSADGEAGHGFTPAYDDPTGTWEIVLRNLVTDEIQVLELPVIPRAHPAEGSLPRGTASH